jgi:hypothetical protein
MKTWTSLLIAALLLGCQPEIPERSESRSDAESARASPRIGYSSRPLDADDTVGGTVELGEWSQNDYHDTLLVELLSADVALADTVLVTLEGGIGLAGDQDVRDSARKTASWPVTREGLRSRAADAGQLIVLQPTALWDYFKATAGSTFVVDSVRTTIVLRNGTTLSAAIALLWD